MGLEKLDRVLRAGRAVGKVALEEIVVAVNVGDGENLQQQGVIAHQVGQRGIGVDHHLIGQAADPVVVKGLELLVRLAVGPVRVMRRHPRIRHVAEHPGVIAQLEFLRIAVQPELGHLVADPLVPLDQILKFVICHSRCPWPARRRLAVTQGGAGLPSLRFLFGQKRLEGGPDVLLALDQHGLKVGRVQAPEHVEHRGLIVARTQRLDLAVAEQIGYLGQFLGRAQRGRIIRVEVIAVGAMEGVDVPQRRMVALLDDLQGLQIARGNEGAARLALVEKLLLRCDAR